ncbi:hypothetical protein SCLCIDRAFT_1222218 [Scleroderma citrinum Foug A]|uniref:Major facilitator superfamily (MFS) profile domain-containing protein n=1 Tax=Scleroderma citrinum Foug A TaxID=1036808 RepID=A0A0C3DCX8_9AGAM|nr:hypothetical protein SCLCIDRAFT_1222218 [Scleroderma citrinum Foug A]
MASKTREPWGLRWRSSVWFVTAVVSFGITTDLLVYSSIIPVIPFQLQHLHYNHVAALTGWLLCAYSAGLVGATIPIALYAEGWSSRQIPLLFGQLALIGSQILLMLAPNYPLMAIARIFQGISSSMIWVVGLALLCDTTPEHKAGKQLGIAMTGLSFGLLVGSPVGGALYFHRGYHAPFIFGLLCAALDLFARLLIIERRDAIKWGVDPWGSTPPPPKIDSAATVDVTLKSLPPALDSTSVLTITASTLESQTQPLSPIHPIEFVAVSDASRRWSSDGRAYATEATLVQKPASLVFVLASLLRSHRAGAALAMALVYGIINSMQEPTLPLHLEAEWKYTSDQVGLVYLASFIPTLISSPLSGWLSDRIGNDYIIFVCLVFTIPWWILLARRSSVVLFIMSFALQSFFVGGVVPPVTSELATVSRNLPGVGYAHVYGAFNLAFGIGTAVGPVIGGQIYSHIRHGWTILCCISVVLVALCSVLAFCCTGPTPLLSRFFRARSSIPAATSIAKEETLGRDPQEKPEDYQHNRMSQTTINVEAILFDLDGTLIDSTRGVFNAWEEFGKRHPFVDGLSWEEVANNTHGRRLVETLPEYCNIQSDELPKAVREFEDIVINYGGGPEVLPGVKSLLQKLTQCAPERFVIVTSASSAFASAAMTKCGLPLPKSGLITADDIGPGQGKPHPIPYLAGARRISNQADFATKCLVIEDAPSGLAAGKRAGARTLAVCTNHTREFLQRRTGNEKPDFIINNLEHVTVQVQQSGSLLVTLNDVCEAAATAEH